MKGFQKNAVFLCIFGVFPFVTFGSVDRLLEHIRQNNRAKFAKEESKGKGWEKPRPILPKNWKDSAGSLSCDTSHTIGTDGYKTFSISSKTKDCSYFFVGSKSQNCTVAIFCDGEIKLGTSPCTDSYLKLSDGTVGFKEICGNFKFQKPYKPRNSGSDMYVLTKGSSSGKCVAFCFEDSTDLFKKAYRLPKSTMDQGYTSGQCTCGVVNNKGRVVGGETARKFEFPWIGNLVYSAKVYKGYDRVPFCGMSLISDRYAITAAHCFFDIYHRKLEPYQLQALFHTHVMDKRPDLSPSEDKKYSWVPGWNLPQETDESEGSIRVDIVEIKIHPFFDGLTYDYDVALVKFETKVDLESGKVSTICLPHLYEKLDYTQDTKFIVAGWGKPDEQAEVSVRILQKLTLPFIDHKSCEDHTVPSMRHVCAGYLEGGKDSCQGDSGGPLIYKIDEWKNQYILAGLVSSGAGCARVYSPGLYSDMRELGQWVYRHMADGTTKICPR